MRPDPRTDDLAQAIVDTVRTPLVLLDGENRIVTANPAFRARHAPEGEDLVGHSLFEVDAGAWDVPEVRSGLAGAHSGTAEVRDLRVRVVGRTDERRTLLIDARRIRLQGQETDLVLLSAEDVSDRVRYERRIEAYARELERSNQDLESFAHAASHDLQEPLRKIRTYADRITRALDPETLEEPVRRYLERMPQAVERMQLRMDDLLTLARVGREKPSRRPTDLNRVLDAVVGDLEVTLAENGGRVEVEALPTVHADPSQMHLLFQNLVANGLKFARDGAPPRVRVAPEEPPEAHDGKGGEAVRPPVRRIVVEDRGIGFDPEYAERIFLPFHRLHGREEFEGSGVGLAICRRIVEAHGGTIHAEGRPGRGARFHVALPITPEVESTP